jgi:AcrR family transcriptional regulator
MNAPKRLSARQAIAEAGFELLGRNPGISLSEIADHAGVGRATLHRHFASREALLIALAHQAIAEMDQAAEAACLDAPSHTAALKRCLEALVPLGDRHSFLAHIPLDDDAALTAEFERQSRETYDLVNAAKQEGAFAAHVPTSWIVQAYDHLLYAGWESVRAGDTTPAQAATLAWQTLTRGLGATMDGDDNDL